MIHSKRQNGARILVQIKDGIDNVDALVDGNLTFSEFKDELKDTAKEEDKIKLSEIKGEFEQEYNPDLYPSAKEKEFEDLGKYQMCIVISRYNPSGKTSLNFGKIKHCRFGIWPIENCKNYAKKTEQHFKDHNLEDVYNGIFTDTED